MNPYIITEPTCISFSGGRTSAYMLYRVLEANNGLPECARVVFANTGKEAEETLKFVNDCSVNWNVPITWLEYVNVNGEHDFKVVDFHTASRNGEPLEQIIRHFKSLPNPRAKTCTFQSKVRTIGRYLKSNGWTEWNSFVGIRADEENRARKLRSDVSGETPLAPLVDDEVTKEIVSIFWQVQNFDLGLPNRGGVTPLGNCDCCYLKGTAKLQSIINDDPSKADWWIRMEDLAEELGAGPTGRIWRLDQPTYKQMKKFALEQADMFSLPQNESIECFCGD